MSSPMACRQTARRGDENAALLDQQRRMARGMRLMLDNPDLRAIPRNLRHLSGQAGNEAEQVQRYLLGNIRRYHCGDEGLPARVRQPISDSGCAAGRAATRRRAEPGVPQRVIPMRMRREAATTGWPNSPRSFARQAISWPVTPGSMSNTPARPCTTTALLCMNSLAWISTPSATGLNTGGSFRLWFATTRRDRSTWR